MGCRGADDCNWRTQLRGTRRGHAPRGRAIRLPARVARPDLGISLWLDDAAGHSNRHHCSGRHRLRQIHSSNRSVVLRLRLDLENRDLRSVAAVVWIARPLQRRSQPPESSRHSFHRVSHVGQHAGPGIRKNCPERFYGRQGALPGRARRPRFLVFHLRCSNGKLHPLLAKRLALRDASLSTGSRHVDDRHAHADRRRHGWLSFFDGRLEQHHLHRRGGEKSRPRPSALLNLRNLSGDRSLPSRESRVHEGAARFRRSKRRNAPRARNRVRRRTVAWQRQCWRQSLDPPERC